MSSKDEKNGGTAANAMVKVKAEHVAELASFSAAGATMEEQIDGALAACPVAVFIKPACPFCIEVQDSFDRLGTPFTAFSVPDVNGLHAALKKKTGQNTVPYVFINKELIGGCDDTVAGLKAGTLQHRLINLGLLSPSPVAKKAAPAAPQPHSSGSNMAPLPLAPISAKGSAAVTAGRRVPSTLFLFPTTVDDRSARLNGLYSLVVCILVAIFYKKVAAHWTMVGLLADFTMRFVCGSSPIGALSQLTTAIMEAFGSEPRWISGPPKQFAALCGIMFSGLASLFFLLRPHQNNCVYVGLAFTLGLGCATALEGLLGFCLGCFFFSYMVDFGIFPRDVYAVHVGSRAEVEYTWGELSKRTDPGHPTSHTRSLDPEQPTAIDMSYKAKTDDMTREDFHPVKHVKIAHWAMHASLAALAVLWKLASYPASLHLPNTVWHVLGIFSASAYVIWAALYAVRAIRHSNKICKEWVCNLRGNMFVLPFLCLPLYAFLINDWSTNFAKFLFWAGAGPSMLITLLRVADWIGARKEMEHFNSGWLLLPTANLVAAFMGAFLSPQYTNAMQFWFATGLLLWLLLLPMAFQRAVIHLDSDDRLRPLLGAWPAVPAVTALAYLSTFYAAGSKSAWSVVLQYGWRGRPFNDFIYCNLYWFSVALFLICLLLFIRRPYFARTRFEMSHWAAGFPTAAIAMAALVYNIVKPGHLSLGIACASLAVATGTIAMLLAMTLASIARRGVFVPDYKWGPLSFMRLTHEAIRGAMGSAEGTLGALVEGAKGEGKGTAGLAMALARAWGDLEWVHSVHSWHEDEVIFRTYEDFIPGCAAGMHDDHSNYHATAAQISGLLQQLLEAANAGQATANLVSQLDSVMKPALTALEDHLRSEEDHLQPLPRRHLPLAVHKEIVREVFLRTPSQTWFKLLPWTVNNLPMLQQRVRFIKTLLWALPERAQQLGTMLALGTEAAQWRRITDELPELIPRGGGGWERYY